MKIPVAQLLEMDISIRQTMSIVVDFNQVGTREERMAFDLVRSVSTAIGVGARCMAVNVVIPTRHDPNENNGAADDQR